MNSDIEKFIKGESKNSYNKNNGVGNYFLLEWKELKYKKSAPEGNAFGILLERVTGIGPA